MLGENNASRIILYIYKGFTSENNRNQVSQLNTDLIKYFNGGKHLALKLTLSVIYYDADVISVSSFEL